jgi:hypothetical protein
VGWENKSYLHLPPPLGHEIIYLCQAVYEYYVHHHVVVDDKEIMLSPPLGGLEG